MLYQEKGVLILQYTDLFKELFTLKEPTYFFEHYYIVLEPSSCGYCDPDILMFINDKTPVFVECSEKNDFNFILVLFLSCLFFQYLCFIKININ